MEEPEVSSKVLVIVGTRLYAQSLAQSLTHGLVAECATTLKEGIRQAAKTRPNIILLDPATCSGASAVPALRSVAPRAKVIILAVPDGDARVLAWVQWGIDGCLTVSSSATDLHKAIASVTRGEFSCSPRLVGILARRLAVVSNDAATRSTSCLTGRQQQIAALLAQGLPNKEIARRLSLEVATIKNHVHSILEKLHVQGRTEVAAHL